MNESVEVLTRGVVLRERYIRGTYTRILRLLLQAETRLLDQLEKRLEGLSGADRARFQQDDWTTKRLVLVRESIQDLANRYRVIMDGEIRVSARELIGAETQLALNTLSAAQSAAGLAVVGELSGAVSEYQIYTAAVSQPFNGTHLKQYMKGVEEGVRRRVLQSLRTSFANGESIPDAVKVIRGTKAKGYSDGIMDISRRSAQMLTRTTMTHIAARTHEAIYADLGVDEVMFIATLDSRTTYGCAALDQSIWPLNGKKPSIPRHLNCRSAWVPHLPEYPITGERTARPDKKTEYVPAGTNFDKWLGQQSAGFQREWLGATRYKLWKEGVPLKKFIDPRFREYSATELLDKYQTYAKAA